MPKLPLSAGRFPVSRRSAPFNIEPLEQRTLFSVALNAAGSTVITPPAGARVVYCSSSGGNDLNNGVSPSSPVKSLARAKSILRNHSGDELLLKDGDSWSQTFGVWSMSGASAQTPLVIGSYGSGARPTILSGTISGFLTVKVAVSNLAVMGINFISSSRDPALTKTPDTHVSPTGFDFQSGGSNILVENCEFQDYAIDVNIENVWGTASNVTFRRNVIINAWAVRGHAEGLYALGVHGLTLDGNYFDHDGYADGIPWAGRTIYNQDCYLSYDNSNVVVKDNIFSRAGSTGLQDRPGGIVEGNIFIDNPVGMTFGLVNGAHSTPGGVTGVVSGNVFLGGANIGSLAQGMGLEIGNINRSGATISNNIFSTGITNSGPAITLAFGSGQSNPTQSVGLNNVTLSHNTVYKWKAGLEVINGEQPGGTGLRAFNNVSFISNQFEDIGSLSVEQSSSLLSQEHWSGNTYYKANVWLVNLQHARPIGTILSSPMAFPAPTRSIASYDQSIGRPGSLTDLLALESTRSEQTWNTKLDASAIVAYIDAGF